MSYILEALKKSEARRRLGRAPDLMEALPERARKPGRIRLALLGLLAVVVGGAGGIWLSSGKGPPATAPGSAELTPAGDGGQARTPVPAAAEALPAGEPAPVAVAPATTVDEPARAPGQNAAPPRPEAVADSPPPLAGTEATGPGNRAGRGPPSRGRAQSEGTTPATASATVTADAAGSGVADAPAATQPAPRETPLQTLTAQAAERERRHNELPAEPEPEGPPALETMPYSYRSQLPPMALNVHVYAPRPEERFVLINMARYQEGDQVGGGGIWVVEITPEGAVLEYAGREFLLKR